MMLGRLLRRMRLLLAVFALTGVVSLAGVVIFLMGSQEAGLLVLLLATQLLVVGSVTVLYRAVLRTRARGAEEPRNEPAPISLDDVIEGVRAELAQHARNEEALGQLLQNQAAARSQRRRELFDETFGAPERG